MSINVTRSSMPSFEEYCDEIKELWDSHWLTNMGTKHRKLQLELEKYLGVPHVTLYTNGHLALKNIIAAMELPQGSEVITTPFTFVSTTHAIVQNGLIPVFCDINENDYTIDVTKIEELITDRTSAIVPVHVYGTICDVDAIAQIAKRHGLKVIYDAAHAFGVTYKGISSACFGDASMFSFHATKVYNTIEGGAVCYKEDSLVQVLDDMKNFGFRGQERVAYVGGNAKMSEFQAAMGLCNLRYIQGEIDKRKHLAERYNECLNHVAGIKIPQRQDDVEANYAYYPVVFEGGKKIRDDVFEELKKQDISARKYFYPLTSEFECYENTGFRGVEKILIAKKISESVLTLPIYADLEMDDVYKICEIVQGVVSE